MEWPLKRRVKPEEPPQLRAPAPPASVDDFPKPTISIEDVHTPEQFMTAINLQTVNEIFDNISERSHAQAEWVGRSRIEIVPEPIVGGTDDAVKGGRYDPGTGQITISWGATTGKHHPDGIAVLHAVIHEMAHARSAYVNDWKALTDILNKTKTGAEVQDVMREVEGKDLRIQLGFSEVHGTNKERREKKMNVVGNTLNEAVTERIAIEVLGEYLRRTGDTKKVTSNRQNMAPSVTESYLVPRIILGIVIESLARALSTDEETVWRGFVASYMKGDMRTRDLLGLVADELSKDKMTNSLLQSLLSQRVPEYDKSLVDSFRSHAHNPTMRAVHGLDPRVLNDALHLKK